MRQIILAAVLVLAACAGPPPTSSRVTSSTTSPADIRPAGDEARFRAEIATFRRVNRVAWPILTANRERCDRLGFAGLTTGIAAANLLSFKPERRALAGAVLQLDRRPRVLAVPDGTPAFAAGIREGDLLVEIGDTPIPAADDSPRLVTEALGRAIRTADRVSVTVVRGAERLTLAVQPVAACRFALNADDSPEIEAVIHGERATISEGLARLTANDSDLALVLAHEIGHLLAGRAGGDVFADGTPARFSRGARPSLERDADRLGLALAVAAGYEPDGVVALWQRISAATPAPTRQSLAAAHPVTPERLSDLAAALSEVRAATTAQRPEPGAEQVATR